MEFKAQPRTIRDALDLKRKYLIPRFQREYSWGNEELDALWDDLLENLKFDENKLVSSEYFIGSLVLVGDDDDTNNIEKHVVDGQQRLMTITIIFSVLSQLFKAIGEDKLSELAHGYIVGEDEDGQPYAKVVSETPKPFFQYRIQQKDIDFTQVPRTAEEKRILQTYKFFEERLGEKCLQEEISNKFSGVDIDYVDALKLFRDQLLKCKVIYVTVKDFDEAYTIFEVLNAKGKDLTPVDVIKNKLFSVLDQTEPIDMAYDKWNNIRANLTTDSFDDILTFYRHYWLSKYGFATYKKLVSEFDKKIDKTYAEYENFLLDLEEASEDYSKIVCPNIQHWPQPEERVIYETIEALAIFGVTQVRSFLLALIDARRRNVIKHSVILDVMEYLQYFHFVFNAVCSERPSGLERKYSSYSRRLRTSSSKQESAVCIKELKKELEEIVPPIDKFKERFALLVFTSKNTKHKKVIQYILRKLERYAAGTDEMKPDSFTIEHIMPESTEDEKVGKIGNLIPLGEDLNCQLGDKDFEYKISRYPKSQYQSVKVFVREYGDFTTWDREQIDERTEQLAEIMYNRNK